MLEAASLVERCKSAASNMSAGETPVKHERTENNRASIYLGPPCLQFVFKDSDGATSQATSLVGNVSSRSEHESPTTNKKSPAEDIVDHLSDGNKKRKVNNVNLAFASDAELELATKYSIEPTIATSLALLPIAALPPLNEQHGKLNYTVKCQYGARIEVQLMARVFNGKAGAKHGGPIPCKRFGWSNFANMQDTSGVYRSLLGFRL